MTAPHSPTPSYGEPWIDDEPHTCDCEGNALWEYKHVTSDQVSRALACVNACAGLANPDKLPELIAAIERTHDQWQDADLHSSNGQLVRGVILDALTPIMAALRALQATPAESETAE